MKKQLLLLIISSLLVAETSGQYWYSKYYGDKELSELNSKELSLLYEKSNSVAHAGLILTIAGSASSVIGLSVLYFTAMRDIFTWDYSGDARYSIASLAAIVGSGVTVAGIPTWIIGAQRRKMISDVINSKEPVALIQIVPSIQYNHYSHGYSSGLKLCIIF